MAMYGFKGVIQSVEIEQVINGDSFEGRPRFMRGIIIYFYECLLRNGG